MINDPDPTVAAVSLRSEGYASDARAGKLREQAPTSDNPERNRRLVDHFDARARLFARVADAAERCGNVAWWKPGD